MTGSELTSSATTVQSQSSIALSTNQLIVTKETHDLAGTENLISNDVYLTESDGESGYVEYDGDYIAVRKAVTSALFKAEQRDVVFAHTSSKSPFGYFCRALMAAIPFYVLFFLLWLIPFFLPLICTDEVSACLKRNTLHSTIHPLLTWTDGPPPT